MNWHPQHRLNLGGGKGLKFEEEEEWEEDWEEEDWEEEEEWEEEEW